MSKSAVSAVVSKWIYGTLRQVRRGPHNNFGSAQPAAVISGQLILHQKNRSLHRLLQQRLNLLKSSQKAAKEKPLNLLVA